MGEWHGRAAVNHPRAETQEADTVDPRVWPRVADGAWPRRLLSRRLLLHPRVLPQDPRVQQQSVAEVDGQAVPEEVKQQGERAPRSTVEEHGGHEGEVRGDDQPRRRDEIRQPLDVSVPDLCEEVAHIQGLALDALSQLSRLVECLTDARFVAKGIEELGAHRVELAHRKMLRRVPRRGAAFQPLVPYQPLHHCMQHDGDESKVEEGGKEQAEVGVIDEVEQSGVVGRHTRVAAQSVGHARCHVRMPPGGIECRWS